MTTTPEVPPVPAKKTAAKKKTAKAPKVDRKPGNNLYLSALPTGWTFDSITMRGAEGETIDLDRNEDGTVKITFRDTSGVERNGKASSMTEAGKSAAKGARTLAEVAKREAALRELRDEGFASLGDLTPGEPEPDA